jgi:hypothetical protein
VKGAKMGQLQKIMKVVSIISYPRTGSSLLIHQARSLPMCALLEIFHPDESVARKHLSSHPYGDQFSRLASAYNRHDILNDIPAFIEELRSCCPNDILTFKIFPGHLHSVSLEQLIRESSAVLVHTRNRLHSFISDLIAGELGKWGGVNTTTKTIYFKEEEFQRYLKITQDFLSCSIDYAIDQKKSILFSSFEDLKGFHCPEEQLHYVGDIFSHVTGHTLRPLHESRDLPRQQDERSYASDKVVNTIDLTKFMSTHQAQALDSNDSDITYSHYCKIIQGRQAG